MLLSFALPTFGHIGMLLLLVLGFGFVIFWHELGHFLAAKWVGIRVEQFAVGFGHAVIAWRKGIGFRVGNTQKDYREKAQEYLARKGDQSIAEAGYTDAQIAAAADELGLGETEYRLNWLPLGGYVKMAGQDDLKPDAPAEDPRAYTRKSISARMLVISAGVIMNIILAAIGFMVLFLIGFNVAPAWVGNVLPNSPAQHAGLRVGDHILYFNGNYEADFTKITLDTALVKESAPIKLIVSRPDHPGEADTTYHNVELTVTPARANGDSKFLAIGFMQPHSLRGVKNEDITPINETNFLKTQPKDYLLLRPGDVITAVNGQSVSPDDYVKFDQIVQAAHGKLVSLTIKGEDGRVRENQTFQPHFATPFGGEFNLAGLLPRVAVESITDNSPVVDKLQPFDVIESLDDSDPFPNPSHELFMKRMKEDGQSGHTINFSIVRDGKTIALKDIKATAKLGEGRVGLGVGPMIDEQYSVVADVMSKSPAQQAGIKPGDTITSIDGQPVANWFDVHRVLAGLTLDPKTKVATAKVSYTRPQADKPIETELKLNSEQLDEIKNVRYTEFLSFGEFTRPRKTASPMVAAGWGITETRDFILQFYLTLRRMAGGSISPANMMGPVGIFGSGKAFAYKGIDWLIWFLSMISANLAVVNFLPIPVVDGGQFTFLIFEKIKGKPLSARSMAIAQYVGLAFLAAVVLFVTYHDVWRIIG